LRFSQGSSDSLRASPPRTVFEKRLRISLVNLQPHIPLNWHLYSIVLDQIVLGAIFDTVLSLSFFLFAEVCCPLEFACVSAKLKGVFAALTRTEPQNRPVVSNIHHACASLEFAAAERTFPTFGHRRSSPTRISYSLSPDFLGFSFRLSQHQNVLHSHRSFHVPCYDASPVSSF
jgi:hypothetical protein